MPWSIDLEEKGKLEAKKQKNIKICIKIFVNINVSPFTLKVELRIRQHIAKNIGERNDVLCKHKKGRN